jgi:hypothetical protein
MKRIVGIDFGTTNVRIAQRDDKQSPSIRPLGRGDSTTMPAVVAFRRQPGGDVTTIVGEDADRLVDGPDIIVIRNIKRWSLGSDPYVRTNLEWHLEQRGDERRPEWWDPEGRAVRMWNQTVPVEEVLRVILKEAISRAGLVGSASEWRAGCPVNSDLSYRRALVSALSDLGCAGKVSWITEEPTLFCAFGMAIGSLRTGSYLVYDVGGGSFDCAIAEIKREESDGQHTITILAQESVPTLGGVNIDDALKEKFRGVPLGSLRVAKEQLTSADSVRLSGTTVLTMKDVETALESEAFISKTLDATLRAYRSAKLWWKRERHAGAPPIGESLGEQATVQSLGIWDMVSDIDEVLLVGGPTQLPYFRRLLGGVFGEEKIVTTRDLSRRAGMTAIPDVALTALSYGACYMQDEQYVPRTVERVPATITLEVAHGDSEDRYEAYSGLPCCAGCTRPWKRHLHPMAPYEGDWIALPPLSHRSRTARYSYTVHIESPDGESLLRSPSREMRLPGGYTRPRADRARLVVDRLGRVWVQLEAGTKVPTRKYVLMVQEPPWQSPVQRELTKKQYQLMIERRGVEESDSPSLEAQRFLENPLGASYSSREWSEPADLTIYTGYPRGRRA